MHYKNLIFNSFELYLQQIQISIVPIPDKHPMYFDDVMD